MSSNNAQITCQCGAISLEASLPKPKAVYVCHCLECRKQSASAFGTSAIFPAEGMWPLPAHVQANIGVWSRLSDAGNTIEAYFCKVCGVRIFHRCIFPDGQVKPTLIVKGGLVEGFTLEDAVHIWTRTAIVAVPEGSFLKEPRE